jgi:hypothetical protein
VLKRPFKITVAVAVTVLVVLSTSTTVFGPTRTPIGLKAFSVWTIIGIWLSACSPIESTPKAWEWPWKAEPSLQHYLNSVVLGGLLTSIAWWILG